MRRLKKIIDKFFNKKGKRIFLYILLLSIAIVLKTDLFVNSDINLFNFSGIFLFLIVYIFGRKIGYVTASLTIIISMIVSNHSTFELIYILEMIFIFELFMRKNVNLILGDILFWGVLVAPILVALSLVLESSNGYEFFDFILVLINSLIDVFVTEIIIIYLIKGNVFKNRFNIKLKDVLIHIITAIILIPFVINVYIDIFNSYDYIYKTNEQSSKDIKGLIDRSVEEWDEDDVLDLKLGGIVPIENLRRELEKILFDKPHNIYITDSRDEKVILEAGKENFNGDFLTKDVGENQYKITLEKSQKDKIGYNLDYNYLVYKDSLENTGLNAYVLTSMKVYRARIIEEHVSQIKFLLLFVCFIIIYLVLIKKTMFKNAAIISENTRNLPVKIKYNDKINWPKSGIYEINAFINNMKTMSDEMENIFNKLNDSQNELFNLAYYDSLTKLPNRLSFRTHLEDLTKIKGAEFAVMLLDIDKFKSINDTLGHTIGDKLLIEVADRLKELINNEINVYRLGGDEFTVLVVDKDIEKVGLIAKNICDLFKREIRIDDIILSTKCSLGVSLFPKDAKKTEDIIKFADIAMYESKEKDLGIHEFFNVNMMKKIDRRVLVEKKLKRAIKNDKLKLFMQPKISKDGITLKGYECLLRWEDDELGNVYPDEFINIAEESSLIFELDNWVINEGCRINKVIQDVQNVFIPVSVNISGKHFTQDDLLEKVKKALVNNSLLGKYLKIEVTESVLIQDIEKAIRNMNSIKELGVQISMDDFGKGYSSMTQLIKLPIDELKIDRDFVKEINKETKKKNIVKLIVNTAKELGLRVVAEGVENEEERIFVINLGCDEIQGYYYSKPLNEESFNEYIKMKGAV